VVVNPLAELPKVLSPTKVQHIDKKKAESLPDFYKNLRSRTDEQQNNEAIEIENSSGSDDSEDLDFVDSDNEVEHRDDDLFVDYVDDDVVDEGVAKGNRIGRRTVVTHVEGENGSSDDEGLHLPDNEVEGQVNLKFKNFNKRT
jgi:hypothetical protein